MDQYTYADNLAAELEIWAALDGCEGGDFLRALASAVNMAHYSYVDEDGVSKKLFQIALEEIYVHWDFTVFYGEGHQDPEYEKQMLDEIQRIWRPEWQPPNEVEAKV